MLRPARLLGRLTSPRLRLRADRPTRLRQSLPQPESPPARVCYHYSAQPPIAEAGFSPACISKIEGCTRRTTVPFARQAATTSRVALSYSSTVIPWAASLL